MVDKSAFRKGVILILGALFMLLGGRAIGLEPRQYIVTGLFSMTILGAILFWEMRLSFAFLVSSIMLLTGITSLERFILSSSWDIIFFLLGMMILVAALKELGVFTWLLGRALCLRNMSARKFLFALIFSSALFACAVDEVSSIIFMIMVVFEMSDFYEVDPVPFIITSVLATNIGSTGTVVGNPIGIFIAVKSGLTFEDFIVHSFPLMLVCLIILFFIMLFILKKPLRELEEKMRQNEPNDILVRLLAIPPESKQKAGIAIFLLTLLAIGFHHRMELLLGLERNTVLLIIPLIASSVVIMWRWQKARSYVAEGIEWWTVLFFIFLFAQAGILEQTGAPRVAAEKLMALAGNNETVLTSAVFLGSGVISSILDNVVVVATLTPIIKDLVVMSPAREVLWWALLFGACLGGNLTIIGSTANIVAIGTLEKDKGMSISFVKWMKEAWLPSVAAMGVALFFFIFCYHLVYR